MKRKWTVSGSAVLLTLTLAAPVSATSSAAIGFYDARLDRMIEASRYMQARNYIYDDRTYSVSLQLVVSDTLREDANRYANVNTINRLYAIARPGDVKEQLLAVRTAQQRLSREMTAVANELTRNAELGKTMSYATISAKVGRIDPYFDRVERLLVALKPTKYYADLELMLLAPVSKYNYDSILKAALKDRIFSATEKTNLLNALEAISSSSSANNDTYVRAGKIYPAYANLPAYKDSLVLKKAADARYASIKKAPLNTRIYLNTAEEKKLNDAYLKSKASTASLLTKTENAISAFKTSFYKNFR